MTTQTYTAEQVKEMLGKSMKTFQASMIALIRECAAHETYKGLLGREALNQVADRLEKLK